MGACPWKYALGKPGEGVPVVGGSAHKHLGTLGLGVVLALIRHRVAFRVAIVPCIFCLLLGVLLHWGFRSRPLWRLVWACCCGRWDLRSR
jgi:hypothetical protein